MKLKGWQLFVVALVVLAVAAAFVVPVVGAAVARAGGNDSVAIEYPGHIKWPGYECQSGHACGGRMVAEWPPVYELKCQSGTACGG